jgi:2'-5' RNA ligase
LGINYSGRKSNKKDKLKIECRSITGIYDSGEKVREESFSIKYTDFSSFRNSKPALTSVRTQSRLSLRKQKKKNI